MRPYTNLSRKNCYHIVGKVPDVGWSDMGPKAVWTFWLSCLNATQAKHSCTYRAFLMMTNHFHLLVDFQSSSSEVFLMELRWLALREFASLELYSEQITSYPHYKKTYEYIYQNPVAAGLVRRPLEYQFSSLQILTGRQEANCFFVDNMNLFHRPEIFF